ncbi:juvenile hormone esterase-like [Musca autumnalis]|uniref:juvenile hormone esterase-like n=1 Tax=Musca autumnalis TaxID=221902 RepID=UPI003CE765EE
MPCYRISSFEAFLGVPYALPPLGNLRFSHPQPHAKWQGILDATRPKPDCIQKNVLIPNSEVTGEEDCLYMNIYRPQPSSNNPNLLPVMVYFHGGGFYAGSPNPQIVGPEYFMDTQGVILAVPAYRLGIFGFLSTNDSVISGNFGLKDQTLALKWIQQNIEAFGGDPKRVTIFGQSAGGIASHLHMLSKHSEGLFESVIAQSGTASVAATLQEDPLSVARETASHLNIPNAETISSSQLLENFRLIDAHAVMAAVDKLKYWHTHRDTVFSIVVENQQSPEAFLTQHPLEIMRNANYNPTRFMAGIVPEEGAVFSISMWEFEELRNSLNEDFNALLERLIIFPLRFSRSEIDEAMQKIIEEYFHGHSVLNKEGILNLFSDRVFLHSFYQDTKMFAHTIDTEKFPLLLYVFNYKGPHSYASLYSGGLKDLKYGVVHADELLYLFRSPEFFSDFPINSIDAKVSQDFVQYFVDFATNRNSVSIPKCNKENYPLDSFDTICNYTYFHNESNNSYSITARNYFNVSRLRVLNEIFQY